MVFRTDNNHLPAKPSVVDEMTNDYPIQNQDVFYAATKSEIINSIAESSDAAGVWWNDNATETTIEDLGSLALQAFAQVAQRNEIGLLPKEFRAVWDKAIYPEIDASADHEGMRKWERAA
jgi:hypothetical protein